MMKEPPEHPGAWWSGGFTGRWWGWCRSGNPDKEADLAIQGVDLVDQADSVARAPATTFNQVALSEIALVPQSGDGVGVFVSQDCTS